MNKPSTLLSTVALAVASALMFAACGGEQPAADKPVNARPAVPVSTVAAERRDLERSLDVSGTVAALSAVEVRPQISGLIARVHVKEGQQVREGELLFTLDTRSQQAEADRLRAQVTRTEAQLADARRQLARARELLAQGFVSQGAVDTAQAAVDAQSAGLQADRASLAAAQVTLAHGQVRAAGAGRVGAIPVFAGSAVQANVTTLATVTRMDPVDVAFSLPQSLLPELLALLESGQAKVEARLPDSSKPLTGKLHFVDSAIDAATGTVKAKARFDNRELKLWPGSFVRVRLPLQKLDNAVVIPLPAVIQAARGPMVYVAQDGKAVQRPVKVLASQDDQAAVSGIEAGDRVIVEGRQNLRPDAPIAERQPGQGKGDKATKGEQPAKAAP
jgi:RND family efflux transporter MFP subunit